MSLTRTRRFSLGGHRRTIANRISNTRPSAAHRRKLGFETLEDRRLLSIIHYNGGPSGTGTSWQNPANWVGGVLPGPADDVVINAASGITIVHSSGNNSIKSLVSANALALSGGALIVANTFEVDNTFTINGGTLSHATILPGSGGQAVKFTNSGGTLDGVTAASDLDLASNNGVSVHIVNGLTLNNSTVRLGNAAGSTYGGLYFDGAQTLGGTGAVVFGKSGSNFLDTYNTQNNNPSAGTLTIGAGITVRGSAGNISNAYYSAGVVNQGTIAADDSGGASSFAYDTGFTNSWTGSTADAIDTSGVSNPAPAVVYQTWRSYYGFNYALANLTPGASYTVRLHFAEPSYSNAGQREFNVSINGTQVLTDFDIVAAAGGKDKAVVAAFTATADSNGQIAVNFSQGAADYPLVNGIEVLSGSTAVQAVSQSVPAPSPTRERCKPAMARP
ncbi:MAG: malectin domain-containing carbohydrate-binding protein [Thermoguttaceae bacterium]